jgi:hypothetical protein
MKVADGVEMFELSANLANGPGVIHPTLFWENGASILVDAGLPGQLPLMRGNGQDRRGL